MHEFNNISECRNIIIVESRAYWPNNFDEFDPKLDLVLTYDFALKREVESIGGQAMYLDHLASQQEMQENNFRFYDFFKKWHLDDQGNDIFTYQGVPFGFSFRLDIWNDCVFYVRCRICLEKIRKIRHEKLFLLAAHSTVKNILLEMGVGFFEIPCVGSGRNAYLFPIFQWMDEKIHTKTIRHRIRDVLTLVLSVGINLVGKIFPSSEKPAIFMQEYYPTRDLLQVLKKESRVRLILAHYSWDRSVRNLLTERPIPTVNFRPSQGDVGDALLERFKEKRCAKLVLSNHVDVAQSLYAIIENRISKSLRNDLRILDCVIDYFNKTPIKLAVLIANIGKVATMVDCVCKKGGIPSYLIINGFMSGDFLDESKYATTINSYSTSIKENYFKGMDNVVCLGDPRMDNYAKARRSVREINRDFPVITIGPAAHSCVDLNSYLAVEFEFMYDILSVLKNLRECGRKVKVVIKIRSNGYRAQYEEFVAEYFPGVVDEILCSIPMQNVLEKTDFYISTYSQTLFEASCLGVPALYYKNDLEVIDAPYDGNSELVTAKNKDELETAVNDFFCASPRYDCFLNQAVMEKYIGPLDGKNLQRNLNYVYSLVGVGEGARA